MTSNRSQSLVAAVALATLASACGGSTGAQPVTRGTTGGDGGNPAATAALAAAATEFCDGATVVQFDRLGACLQASAAAVASWKASAATACRSLGGEVAAGRSAYDAAQGHTCQAAFATLDCAALVDTWNSGANLLSLPGCGGAIAGRLGAGETCYDDADCAAGYCTGSFDQVCPGKCAPLAREGESCGGSPCAPGLECAFGAGAPTCRARAALGGPCPCQRDFFCDASGTVPSCQPRRTSGSCKSTGECAAGHACAGAPSTCQPLATAGASCLPSAPACAPGYGCDPRTGACATPPALGGTCVVTQGATTYTLSCSDGYCDAAGTKQCSAHKPDGAACTLDPECLGHCDPATLHCADGTGLACAAP